MWCPRGRSPAVCVLHFRGWKKKQTSFSELLSERCHCWVVSKLIKHPSAAYILLSGLVPEPEFVSNSESIRSLPFLQLIDWCPRQPRPQSVVVPMEPDASQYNSIRMKNAWCRGCSRDAPVLVLVLVLWNKVGIPDENLNSQNYKNKGELWHRIASRWVLHFHAGSIDGRQQWFTTRIRFRRQFIPAGSILLPLERWWNPHRMHSWFVAAKTSEIISRNRCIIYAESYLPVPSVTDTLCGIIQKVQQSTLTKT